MPSANPLPPCPGTPNCVRTSRHFANDPDTLFTSARSALEAIGAAGVTIDEATRSADAVFSVFFFKDDVALIVEPHDEGSMLHIRSASRVGRYDFGVNHRRVRRFFKVLDAST